MYKECFKLMDVDKDGTLSKNDLRAAFDNVGKLMDESDLDSMLGEVGGSCTFDAMIKCSKRRWLVVPMIPMTSSFVLSKLMKWSKKRMARRPLKLKCSVMP